MSSAASPPALQEAIHSSTSSWQQHLESLFKLAKDRFPDVVWELGDGEQEQVEEVWGHKAIVYARAPPSFQARYFSLRHSPSNTQSALSLPDFRSGSSSPYRAGSPSPSTNPPGTLLRLPTNIKSALFSNELEYLYTGKGFGVAFEFLFDSTESREEGDAEENRIDKLRKDLVFMWRSRLYSDCRIALNGTFASANHETATAIFSSHRFILVSRSPYFHTQLLSWPATPKPNEPLTITLPSPPFTPASLHFTLGYIYTGTLVFSHRSYDLDTAFHIMRSATYLGIDTLYDEVQARIVQEMLHGLFHAFLEFAEYERITGGKWGTGGCRCRQCARRVPRVLEFAISEDVKNPHLERGARRALVGLFGEGWCTAEFAGLPQKVRDSLLKGLMKRTTPVNVFALLYAAQHAMEKLNVVIDAWADVSREMVIAARKVIDDVLCMQAEECFEQPEWLEVMESDGDRFEDADQVGLVMDAVKRGLSESSAGMVYQVLVSSILLRPHITERESTMLSSNSPIREQVEVVRMEVLKWLRKRWMGVRHEGGFNDLEGWAIKEISGEIEVPVEDLINNSPSSPPRGMPTRSGLRATLSKVDPDADSVSLRASVLSRNTMNHKRSVTPTHRADRHSMHSSASSMRSVARSEDSTATYTTTNLPPMTDDIPKDTRPDSKLTPSPTSAADNSSLRHSVVGSSRHSVTPSRKTLVTKVTPRNSVSPSSRSPSMASSRSPSLVSARPKSLAPSVASLHSRTSPTQRHSLRPPPAGGSSRPTSSAPRPVSSRPPRPTSSLSNTSDGSTTFQTAQSEITGSSPTVSRRTSVASSLSNGSNRTQGPSTGKITLTRPRVPSAASSANSTTSKAARTSLGPSDISRKSPSPASVRRPPSMASVRSTISVKSTVSSINATPTQKKTASKKKPVLSTSTKGNGQASPTSTAKGKSKATTIVEEETPAGKASMESNHTVRQLKKKESSDTIKNAASAPMVIDKPLPSPYFEESEPPSPQVLLTPPLPLGDVHEMPPRGATLEIGIPCIISSKRKRFRAYARYIGEVEGEFGPWVGVEVPVGESWVGEQLEGRQWHDGSWGGVRYFDIGSAGSEWDDGDNDRSVRRRKLDIMNGSSRNLKREGDQLSMDRSKRFRSASPAISDVSMSESRGLFVRPQQVLYVVDAVGADL